LEGEALIALQRRLRAATSIPDLLLDSCIAARETCGFGRALIVSVADQMLTAGDLRVLPDGPSDSLRRHLLGRPLALVPGSAETDLIRRAEGGRGRTVSASGSSQLQEALGLMQFALGAIMPEDRVLALLVVDRDAPELADGDRDDARLFGWVVGLMLERLFHRVRLRELGLEIRHLTASAEAALREATDAPVSLPTDYGAGPVFAPTYPAPVQPDAALRELFTRRELQIANSLVAGGSNREIAAALHLSPETVKAYVARVLRKLGAANRADAVARYMRLAGTHEEH
jgi:DNA-binding CsgD family transcriptional regulator